MRPILAMAIFFLCVSSASPEPEYSSLLPGSFNIGEGDSFASLVEIETSTPRGDREKVAAPFSEESIDRSADIAAASLAQPASYVIDPDPQPLPAASDTTDVNPGPPSLDQICNALMTAAQNNNLPVPFFANLIWQESRLQDDAVSPKGALGIAQFMPEVALETGLDNPFDPMQALPASARLLHALRDQFGNLGLVAAAYNAGATRVMQWLERRRSLPRETRGYVLHVTGRSVQEWRKTPPDDEALRLVRRMPCRDLPAFAQLEEDAQLQEAQLQRAQVPPAPAPQPVEARPVEKPRGTEKTIVAHDKREHVAERKHPAAPAHHEGVRTAERSRHHEKHEASEHVRRVAHEHRLRV